jgi:methylated-DNA-[protein]-cysteine S-methyltransferase
MKTEAGFTLFDTAIGRCAMAWTDRGIAALQLPERDDGATLARLRRHRPDAVSALPPAPVTHAIAAIVALLEGAPRDLSDLALDLAGIPPFHQRIYAEARKIPPGSVLTYGEVARRVGEPGAARAVGQAMGRNPFAIIVPCHRVVAAGGALGGFSARGGADTKRQILAIEGARAVAQPGLFDHAQ